MQRSRAEVSTWVESLKISLTRIPSVEVLEVAEGALEEVLTPEREVAAVEELVLETEEEVLAMKEEVLVTRGVKEGDKVKI